MDRILLIEDDPGAQLLFRNRLEELGHEVVIASTGARGLLEARAVRFDLFLVDIELGSGIDGYEVCRRLKAIPAVHGVPVVLVSGQVKEQAELHRGYEAGCDAFVLKGNVTLLQDTVRVMLRLKSLRDDLAIQNRLLEEQNQRLQTERARGADLELALRDAGSRANVFRELAVGRPDGIVVVDGEGIVRWSDRGARDVFGNDLEGKCLGRIAPDAGLEAYVRDARTDPREGHRFDLAGRGGRSSRSLTASVVPLMPGPGETGMKIVLLADARKRRIAAELLRIEPAGPFRGELGPLLEAAREQYHPRGLIGRSDAIQDLRAALERLAPSSAPVLLRGEPGTGKDFAARVLHFSGPGSGPYVAVDCGALSPPELEAALFGYVKGAFEEAMSDRPGCFQQALHGTLHLRGFLELPPELQGRVLRAVRDGEVVRLGSGAVESVQVRVIASTTGDPDLAVADGHLLPELRQAFAAGIALTPLRRRTEDVEDLVLHFLGRFAPSRDDLHLSHEAQWLLAAHSWPGNVRELAACIERVVQKRPESPIRVEDLPVAFQDLHRRLIAQKDVPSALAGTTTPQRDLAEAELGDGPAWVDEGTPIRLEEYERLCILHALRACNDNRSAAAHMLGIGKSTFYRKLQAHGITAARR